MNSLKNTGWIFWNDSIKIEKAAFTSLRNAAFFYFIGKILRGEEKSVSALNRFSFVRDFRIQMQKLFFEPKAYQDTPRREKSVSALNTKIYQYFSLSSTPNTNTIAPPTVTSLARAPSSNPLPSDSEVLTVCFLVIQCF